jgi:uncharacterized phage protein (TIGR01671 family)
MREIKFRAWDKELKKMAHIVSLEYGVDCKLLKASCAYQLTEMEVYGNDSDEPSDVEIRYRRIDFLELMQFTGLHDKNGKEIWEGDIVNIDRQDSFPSYNKAIIGYGDNYGSFLLQYTKPINPKGVLAQGNSITSNNGKILYGYCTGWEIEVIGNIYEHPEMLKEPYAYNQD